ncbi:hypothetical protein ACS0TY_002920 [Phlomoides rotata]
MRGIRHNNWPYFANWIDVFGKYHATGEAAEEVLEAIGEMDGSNPNPNVYNTQESNDDNDFNGEGQSGVNKYSTQKRDEQEENSASQKARGIPRARSTNKKRRSSLDSLDIELTKMLGEFCKSTGERLESIACRIRYDHDLRVARKKIYEQLGNIEWLSIKDRLYASKIIGGKVEILEIWTTLPEEARVMFVMDILGWA